MSVGGLRQQWDNLHALIGQTYDAAQDEKLWSTLAPQIAEAFESTSAIIVGLQGSPTANPKFVAYTANYDARAAEEYEVHYFDHDVWRARVLEMPVGGVFTSEDLITDADFSRTEFYNDYQSKRGGTFYVSGGVFPSAANYFVLAAVHRPRGNGNYDEEDRRRVGEFIPHLARALQMRNRLAEVDLERRAASEATNRTRTATMVVSADGTVIQANDEAEALLRIGDALRLAGKRLATLNRAITERLLMLIRGAAETAGGKDGSSGGALSIPRADRLPVTVLVAPFRTAQNGAGASTPAAIAFVRDPERLTSPEMAVLQGMLGLTPAEATIACHLARGRSVQEIAAHHRLSLNTVRTHLKNIFSKTGTSRQTQLVALLLRSVAVMTRP